MGLDFHWTCQNIDKNIQTFKDNVEVSLEDFMDEITPLFTNTEAGKSLIQKFTKQIYEENESIFEDMRDENFEMRSQADKQIEELEEHIEELDKEIEELNEKLEDIND